MNDKIIEYKLRIPKKIWDLSNVDSDDLLGSWVETVEYNPMDDTYTLTIKGRDYSIQWIKDRENTTSRNTKI